MMAFVWWREFLIMTQLCLLLASSGQTNYEIVRTKYGPVRGKIEHKGSTAIKTFLGIPFASPPVKSLRFMPPVTLSPWKEVLNADRYPPVCPQDFPRIDNTSYALSHMSEGRLAYLTRMRPHLSNQSEDCLYLNVYQPATGSKRPVVMFIHGESYSWGSGNLYDGSALAAFGKVVVVTINYRLGVLGFLNANGVASEGGGGGAAPMPSNLGILDQIAALHWIQENIQDFGGDKTNVTVMGHGRGAAALHFLMTSDALPHGVLFSRVILMSGSALSPWAQATNPANTSRELAQSLSCPVNSPEAMMDCLRKTSLSNLLRQSEDLSVRSNRFETVFGPSYDGVVVHTFKNKVGEYLERMARYDMMIGVTSAEAFTLLNNEEMELGLEIEGRNRLVSDLVTSTYPVHQKEIFSAILTEYTDWSSANRHPIATRDITVEAMSDGLFVAPAVETADYHASLNKQSWFYVFDYQSKLGDYQQRQGCLHGEDLWYVLGYPLLGSQHSNFTRQEVHLAQNVLTYWTNFITSGNPNLQYHESRGHSSYSPSTAPLDWTPYDPTYKKYLQIGLKLKMKDQFRARRVALWLNLIPDLVHSGHVVRLGTHSQMEEYLTYSETLPFLPTIKEISLMKEKSRPALLESQPSSSLSPLFPPGSKMSVTPPGTAMTAQNDTLWNVEGSLSSYSTALSVTIAIGTSLLILNILIFAAVYYQRDRNKMGSRYSLASSSVAGATSVSGGQAVELQQHQPPLPVGLNQQPSGSHPPSVSSAMSICGGGSNNGGSSRTPQMQSRRQSCRLSYIGTAAGGNEPGVSRSGSGGGGPSGSGGAAYLPPPQFADSQSADPTESIQMVGGSMQPYSLVQPGGSGSSGGNITMHTSASSAVSRTAASGLAGTRVVCQQASSDTQPLLHSSGGGAGSSSFRTLPRNQHHPDHIVIGGSGQSGMRTAGKHMFPSPPTSSGFAATELIIPGSQTLPLKSSLKKSSVTCQPASKTSSERSPDIVGVSSLEELRV